MSATLQRRCTRRPRGANAVRRSGRGSVATPPSPPGGDRRRPGAPLRAPVALHPAPPSSQRRLRRHRGAAGGRKRHRDSHCGGRAQGVTRIATTSAPRDLARPASRSARVMSCGEPSMSVRSSNLSPFTERWSQLAPTGWGVPSDEPSLRRRRTNSAASVRVSWSSQRLRLSRPRVRSGRSSSAGLDAAQVAGLAARLGPWEAIPAELRAAADQLALPVITFPRDAEVGDVTAAVLEALLDTQSRRLGRVLEIRQLFTKIALAGGGAAEIASAARPPRLSGQGLRQQRRQDSHRPSGHRSRRDVDADTGVRQSIRGGTHDYGETGAPPRRRLDQDQLDDSSKRRWRSRCDSLSRAPSRKPGAFAANSSKNSSPATGRRG